jgi:hypothetical protein
MPFYSSDSKYAIRQHVDMENCRRAVRIVLALQAWKLEHGEYPKTLDELVGPYFEKLPLDPYSAQPYRYYPKGVKDWIPAPGMNFELLSPGKDRPFIWSTGPEIHKLTNFNVYEIYEMSNRYDSNNIRARGFWRSATSLYDILSHGRCFFLP